MTDSAYERLTALRTEAVARVAATTAALDELMRARQGSNDDDEHDPEGVTLSSEWSRLSGLADAAQTEREQVDAALERVVEGTYGFCVSCGRPIPVGRLEARPFAERCVPCAESRG